MCAARFKEHPNNTPDKRRARASHAGRAPKINQRGVRLSERDEAALESLFLADWLDVECLRDLHYGDAGLGTCRNRLNKIYADKSKQLIKAQPKMKGTSGADAAPRTIYALSVKGRARIARRFEAEGLDGYALFADSEPGPKSPEYAGLDAPRPEKASHLVAVSELYTDLACELWPKLGGPGRRTWYWRNERRAYRDYSLGSSFYVYRPDAELVVAIPESAETALNQELSYAHMLIEVQTAASHKGAQAIEEKVEAFMRTFGDHDGTGGDRHAFEYRRDRDPTPSRWAFYLTCETRAHQEAAHRAAVRLGLRNCWAGSVAAMAEVIEEHALHPTAHLT